MAYFRYQGKSVFYEEYGQGEPLILLHGNTASSNMFLEIAEKYKEHFKVILIDFLGHGKSDRLTEFPADLWFDEAQYMQGDDWESVVDNDTSAIIRHEKEIGKFFHKDLHRFKPDILMTGSKQDEFVSSVSPTYFEKVYGEMLKKIGHGKMYLFDTGGHPAMLTNQDDFYSLSMAFFKQK